MNPQTTDIEIQYNDKLNNTSIYIASDKDPDTEPIFTDDVILHSDRWFECITSIVNKGVRHYQGSALSQPVINSMKNYLTNELNKAAGSYRFKASVEANENKPGSISIKLKEIQEDDRYKGLGGQI